VKESMPLRSKESEVSGFAPEKFVWVVEVWGCESLRVNWRVIFM